MQNEATNEALEMFDKSLKRRPRRLLSLINHTLLNKIRFTFNWITLITLFKKFLGFFKMDFRNFVAMELSKAEVLKVNNTVAFRTLALLNSLAKRFRKRETKTTKNFLNSVLIIIALAGSNCNNNKQGDSRTVSLNIATAANAQFAIQEIATIFEKKVGIKINTIIGSSGKLTAQIIQGAPYDLFLSANVKYPEKLYQDGYAQSPPIIYANGQLVVWTILPNLALDKELSILKEASIRKIGIANPKNAPYGEEAIRALTHLNIYKEVKDKLVYGESIGQTTQFIATKNCEIGITAKSIVSSPAMKGKGNWLDISAQAYQPIQQGMVITKYGATHHAEAAKQFSDFLFSEEAQQIFQVYGYMLPQ